MSIPGLGPAYIVAAKRTALGRVGGLHKSRRIEDLAAPVVAAVLADCGIEASRVDEVIIGNATEGRNPARLIALSAGIPETASASTIDRQCASGLDAILMAVRSIAAGEADIIVAGGAESISTAPWRIAKPKSLYQVPHFIGMDPSSGDSADEPQAFEASEELSRRHKISRQQQDAWALRSHLKANAARDANRFIGEIVPLRGNAEEARDQSAIEPKLEDLERLSPFLPPKGTLTPGNTSALHDGAAMAVVVSEKIWAGLGKPRALKVLASASQGVAPDAEADAPIAAMRKLYRRLNGFNIKDIAIVEMSESSAAQAIALCGTLGLDEAIINPDGGALVRGHPLAASGAVVVVRLFTRMVRDKKGERPKYGVATLGSIGGLGLAALFEAV